MTTALKPASILCVLVAFGLGCASTKPSLQSTEGGSTPESQRRPYWVDTPPKDADFFYGVGAFSATGDPAEDRKKADDAARVAIASQLKIKVSSVVSDILHYKQAQLRGKSQEQWSDAFSRKLSTMVDTTALEGSRIVDRWYDKRAGVYYSLASMSISEFRVRMRKKIETARNLAMSQYRQAEGALKSGAIVSALKHYANALEELWVIKDVPFHVDLDGEGRQEYFRPEVRKKIGEILSQVEIRTRHARQQTQLGRPLPKPLVVRAFYGGMPVKDLPFAFAFVRGSGQLDKNALTNSAGEASSTVYKAESLGSNVVEARIDLPAMLGPRTAGSFVAPEIPRARFVFSCEAISVAVRVIEKNLGQALEVPVIGEAIAKRLLENGFAVVSDSNVRNTLAPMDIDKAMSGQDRAVRSAAERVGADVVVVGEARTSYSGMPMWGVRLCRARATVKAIDVRSGRVLATRDLIGVKGFAKTRKRAGIKALEEAAGEIAAEVVRQLKAAMLK